MTTQMAKLPRKGWFIPCCSLTFGHFNCFLIIQFVYNNKEQFSKKNVCNYFVCKQCMVANAYLLSKVIFLQPIIRQPYHHIVYELIIHYQALVLLFNLLR